ncbi:MAG: hypothetical protein ACXWJB_09395 [Limisphaerales bacterium]
MLTIIAFCLVFQVVNSLRVQNHPVAVTIAGLNVKDGALPVAVNDPVDVNITGVEISKHTPELTGIRDIQSAIPVSIDAFAGQKLSNYKALPVEISR